jgi:hypothetical protein
MKNLSFLNKIIFFLNNIFAVLFIASFVLPYASPKSFPLLSILSLTVPLIIIVHVLFILYWWIIGFKKQFFLSALCILLAIGFSYFPYKFSGKNVISGDSFTVMNFNVRLFNRYHWIDDKNIPANISSFIDQNKPDILAIQEFYPSKDLSIKYPYQHIIYKGDKKDFGQVIYSNYKIINKGSLNFENSSNNAIYIDFIKNSDTIRVYNLHLESLGVKQAEILSDYLVQFRTRKSPPNILFETPNNAKLTIKTTPIVEAVTMLSFLSLILTKNTLNGRSSKARIAIKPNTPSAIRC